MRNDAKIDLGIFNREGCNSAERTASVFRGLSFRVYDSQRHGGVVPHFVDRATMHEIADEFVAVRSQGDEVAL